MLIEDELSISNLDKPIMSLSAYSIQGKRNHMEDFYDIGYQMKPCDQRHTNEWPYEYFYFGIFDGHGGCEAARYAKQNLLKFITRQKDFWSDDDEDVMRAIRQGYADTHTAMRKEMPTWSRTSRILPSTAGTTASVLFIKNGKFYTGHVGDSRIVISQENADTKHWISRQLTDDHKPESKAETQRIQRAGGEVRSKIGVHRVVWNRPVLTYEMEEKLSNGPNSPEYIDYMNLVSTYPVSETLVESYQTIPFLAIARSLGDFWSLNPHSGQYIVSPEPDVSCRPITANDKCILLATDGLWNVINSSQAVRILQELDILKRGKRQYFLDEYFTTDNFYDVAGDDSENHALSMVYFAYQIWERRRLRSDNITVVVAMLHDILTYFQKTNNKAYATRSANVQPEKELLSSKDFNLERVQLGQTSTYLEKIRLNREPKFHLKEPNFYDQKWRRLENFLILPPTILEQEYELKHKLVHPKNYMRLSIAACKKIARRRIDEESDSDDSEADSYIYIKRVSDDPADEHPLPTRVNKSGKEVKDASAQATQCIHDFGQPWDQLRDENEDSLDDDNLEFVYSTYEDDSDTELVFAHELEDEDSETELVFAHELENDKVDDKTSGKEVNDSVRKSKKEEKTIPQLRCLLNYTPPLRRSTRRSYLSISDNAKRKVQLASNTPLPRSKRRKSQPSRCNLARA